MSRPVFGVDRIPGPWPEQWEDGTLLTTEELRELDAQAILARAYHAAIFDPGVTVRTAADVLVCSEHSSPEACYEADRAAAKERVRRGEQIEEVPC